VHTVAQRIGDDPAVLLRNYVKRKRSKQADKSLGAGRQVSRVGADFIFRRISCAVKGLGSAWVHVRIAFVGSFR
jgi:hypothetical protein